MGNFELLLSVTKFKKVLGSNDVVDVSDLESFGFSEQARNYLENRGLMPKPLTWDKHSGEGLSWRKDDFEAIFFKMVTVGRSKRPMLIPKTALDWCQVN